MPTHAFSVTAQDRPGILYRLTQVLAEGGADIRYVDILRHRAETEFFFECEVDGSADPIVERLRGVDGATAVSPAPPMSQVYGKRIIIMGGGAQVGQVALGAITEADRHNIR